MLAPGKLSGLLLGMTMVFLPHSSLAEDHSGRCVLRQNWGAASDMHKEPAAIPGMEPLVSIPSEGTLKLHTASSDCCSSWRSPAGDFTADAGPYDPVSRRLYIWGYFENGWIEVLQAGETWYFGESGTIRPTLYEPADDIEDVTPIERSAVLGVQFYIGYTAPHWLTGAQSYRVYQISGPEMSRVPELEAGRYGYVGDDQAAGLAVFVPAGSSWNGSNTEALVWYDGTEIVSPPAHLPPLTGRCR